MIFLYMFFLFSMIVYPSAQDWKKVEENEIALIHYYVCQGNLVATFCCNDKFAMDKWGNNALHYAAFHKENHIMKMLFDYLPIDSRNVFSETPLLLAARKRNLSSMVVLIQYGADAFAQDKNGYTIRTYLNKDEADFIESTYYMKNI